MQIIVKPISATLSRDTQLFSRMDPYVVCVISNQRQRSKTHHEGGKHPKWNDTMIFQINGSLNMTVQVWDKDLINDDIIGEGYVNLNSYLCSPGIIKNENIVLTYKGKKVGMINLSIQLQGGQIFEDLGDVVNGMFVNGGMRNLQKQIGTAIGMGIQSHININLNNEWNHDQQIRKENHFDVNLISNGWINSAINANICGSMNADCGKTHIIKQERRTHNIWLNQ